MVCVAITGALPTAANTPAVPTPVAEMRAHRVTPGAAAFDPPHIQRAIARHEAGSLYGKLSCSSSLG